MDFTSDQTNMRQTQFQIIQTPLQVEHQKIEQQEYIKCVINGKTYEIQVDMFLVFDKIPSQFQQSFQQDGINWYLVPDQNVQYSENGQQQLAQFQNDKGESFTFTFPLQENWVIQITCTLDAYRYFGNLTEKQIVDIHQNTKIQDLFYNLVHDLNNISENKSENKSITLTLDNSKIKFVYINELQIRKGEIQQTPFQWDLNIYRDEQILERLIKEENKSLKEQIEKFIQNQQSLREELKQNQQSHQNSQEQSLSEILKILNRVHPKEKISHILKPCDLVQTKGCFWVSPKSVQGITTLEFTLKKLNQIGLALGLENNNNSIGNQLAYGIYTKHQLFAFGQTKIKFEYTPQVGDKISLRVDLYEKRVVFEANEQEITKFNLEDLGETEWYLWVGYYDPFENVNDFME